MIQYRARWPHSEKLCLLACGRCPSGKDATEQGRQDRRGYSSRRSKATGVGTASFCTFHADIARTLRPRRSSSLWIAIDDTHLHA